ncbi:aldose 1-epimerase family protein [Edaphosphingomonas haloaromaticamans]|uniref:Aldose 1-epimerase n=1 Tax=Edaphosphingomonas haloaromaticamans TaxID=653954 RepID=A0A1S1HI51_9SPHN|nr:aldose 1-epimerase family protein [Sphingomonas haloaromaticamans]OHT21944.1 Aldose 1-epimerase [Sphingomonas haloaromaticamans]
MSEGDVRIAGDGIAATIAPLGAELQSLTDAEGRELLWGGDPAFWAGRAPILFPIVGTLRNDSYRIDGETYRLPRHGFARRRRFDLVEATAARALFRLADDAETRAAYPFAFQLDMAFAIAGGTLEMKATARNMGDRPLPASFGFHPALRWPLPGAGPREAHRLIFAAGEAAPVRRVDADGLIDPLPRPTPIAGRELALDDALFAEDALILDDLASRSLLYGVPGARMLEIGFPDMPALGLWSKAGAAFLCIEPWQGHADPAGFAGDFRDRPGVVEIAPGAERSFTMTIKV